MRHSYFVLAAVLITLLGPAGQRAQAQAPAWRPFRPGFIYSFGQVGGPATQVVHTLRVDSAYATAAGDSVYTFNRLLRHPVPSAYFYLKSRNNLLGTRLRWQPGTADYYLEANAEPTLGGPAQPVAVLLRPRVAVGSTWVASAQPALTATLSSRALSPVGTDTDTVATITLSNGQQFMLSRRYGLVQGPQWLTLASSGTLPATYKLWDVPQAGLGSYDPRGLFALGVGDELGYYSEYYLFAVPILCRQAYTLRRILARQQTADSLTFVYQQQRLSVASTYPGCATGAGLTPIGTFRWAFSLRTGASPQFGYLPLLTGEYKNLSPTSSATLRMGLGYTTQTPSGSCLNGGQELKFMTVFSTSYPGQYGPGVDIYDNQTISASLGLGPTFMSDGATTLTYYRHNGVVCGSPLNFATLLPTHAALAATAATLHPNPAADGATLTLAAPALPGTTLALTDARGRRVWSTPVAAGQTALPVPLAGQPAGLYLVQLLAPAAAPLTWKLTHLD